MNTRSISFGLRSIATTLTVFAGLVAGCGQAASKEHAASQSAADTVDVSSAFYDDSTECVVGGTAMHCCPTGSAMIGARIDQNVFKCASLFDSSGAVTLDTDTQRNNMHACPLGQVMVGLYADLNLLACQTIPSNPVATEVVDTGTQDAYPMHVCEQSTNSATMTGIRIDQNLLNCGQNCFFGACTDDSQCGANFCRNGCCTIG